GRNIARMQVRAMLVRLVKEVADTQRPFQREGGIEGTPREGESAGVSVFGLITGTGMTDAGKFAFEGASIRPVFRVCYQAEARCRFEEIGGHIFIGQHNTYLRAA